MNLDAFNAAGPNVTTDARVVHLRVRGSTLNAQQKSGLHAAWEAHKAVLRNSPATYLQRHVQLGDGTRITFSSNFGVHQVDVVPPQPLGSNYLLRPAFSMDAPGFGESWPAAEDLNSATWRPMPYTALSLPEIQNEYREEHPGNQYWHDSREDSPNFGLVLSWWGLSKDRYGSNFVYKIGDEQPSPDDTYTALFLNGVKVGTLPASIWGACVCEVDGVRKIAVITVNTIRTALTLVGATNSHYILSYGQRLSLDAGLLVSTGTFHSTSVALYHANCPGDFTITGELEFTLVATMPMANDGTVNAQVDIGGGDMRYLTVGLARCAEPVKFNASGTEGMIPVEAGSLDVWGSPPAGDDRSTDYLLIDPRTATLSLPSAGVAAPDIHSRPASVTATVFVPSYILAAYPAATQWGGACWRDYDEDTLVTVEFGVTDSLLVAHHSVHGELFQRARPGIPVYPVFTGHLGHGVMNFIDWGNTLTIDRFLDDTHIAVAEAFANYPAADLALQARMQVGFEGCAVSWDGRLIVDRCDATTRVFVDGEDVTADLTGVADICHPILCGPLKVDFAALPEPPRSYVVP
jgi:hypothetical protein